MNEPLDFNLLLEGFDVKQPVTLKYSNGVQSKVLASRHTENGDAGHRIPGKEMANWFVIMDLNSLVTSAD